MQQPDVERGWLPTPTFSFFSMTTSSNLSPEFRTVANNQFLIDAQKLGVYDAFSLNDSQYTIFCPPNSEYTSLECASRFRCLWNMWTTTERRRVADMRAEDRSIRMQCNVEYAMFRLQDGRPSIAGIPFVVPDFRNRNCTIHVLEASLPHLRIVSPWPDTRQIANSIVEVHVWSSIAHGSVSAHFRSIEDHVVGRGSERTLDSNTTTLQVTTPFCSSDSMSQPTQSKLELRLLSESQVLMRTWPHALTCIFPIQSDLPPVVCEIMPREGVEGCRVWLYGRHLSLQTRVFFGDSEAIVYGGDDVALLQCISPSRPDDDQRERIVVRVVNGLFHSDAVDTFSYV